MVFALFAEADLDRAPDFKVHAPPRGRHSGRPFRPGFFTGVYGGDEAVPVRVCRGQGPRYALFGKKDYQQLMVIPQHGSQFAPPVVTVVGRNASRRIRWPGAQLAERLPQRHRAHRGAGRTGCAAMSRALLVVRRTRQPRPSALMTSSSAVFLAGTWPTRLQALKPPDPDAGTGRAGLEDPDLKCP